MTSPTALGRRQLFAYWRVPAERLDVALAAVAEWQQRCQQDEPALHAELHLRSEDDGYSGNRGTATVMEVYGLAAAGREGGLDAAWLRRLDEEGDVATRDWRAGPRHLEVFERWR